jgi:hypothetical protein
MALWDEVKLRYPARVLKELTTVDLPGATAIDDTRGTQAATDTEAWFKRVAQLVYDNTDADHKAVAVRAVYVLLREYSGRFAEVVEREIQEVEKKMNQLRDLGPGKRIMPWTDSELDPSDDENVIYPQRPTFDTERFSDVTPNEPPAP